MGLERALFPFDAGPPAALRALPDWAAVAREKKRKGVTLQLLWQEYRGVERDGYSQVAIGNAMQVMAGLRLRPRVPSCTATTG